MMKNQQYLTVPRVDKYNLFVVASSSFSMLVLSLVAARFVG